MKESAKQIIKKYFGDFSERKGFSCRIETDEKLLKTFFNQMTVFDASESEDASETLQRLFEERTEISVIEADTDKGEEIDFKTEYKKFPLFSETELDNEILNDDDIKLNDQTISDLLYSVYAPHWDENTVETDGFTAFIKKMFFHSETVFSFDYYKKTGFLKNNRHAAIVAALSVYSEFARNNGIITRDDELKVMLRLISGLKKDVK